MARLIETTVDDGHFHHYTDLVNPGTSTTQTSIVDGHNHTVVRDGAGLALRIEEADGHTHDLGQVQGLAAV